MAVLTCRVSKHELNLYVTLGGAGYYMACSCRWRSPTCSRDEVRDLGRLHLHSDGDMRYHTWMLLRTLTNSEKDLGPQ